MFFLGGEELFNLQAEICLFEKMGPVVLNTVWEKLGTPSCMHAEYCTVNYYIYHLEPHTLK